MAGRRVPLWVRSVRLRPAVAVSLFLLAATAVTVSVLAPLLLRAVQQSSVADAVASAKVSDTQIAVSADTPAGVDSADAVLAVQDAAGAAQAPELWRPAVVSVESTSTVQWRPGGAARSSSAGVVGVSRVLTLAGRCAGLYLVVGRCPTAAGQVSVAADRAGRPPVPVGSVLESRFGARGAVRLTVVGAYDGSRSPGVALTIPGTVEGAVAGVSAGDLVVDAATLARFDLPTTARAARLLGRRFEVDDVGPARADVAAVQAAVLGRSGNVRLDTGLLAVLDTAAVAQQAAGVLIYVSAAQALLLAWFAQAVVVQRIGRARAAEWGVGRLRGRPRRARLALIYAEPVVALAAGVPVGLLVGVALTSVAADVTLRTGTPVEPWRVPVLGAAVLAAAGSLAALAAASVRSARVPLSELLRGSVEPRALSRLAAVAQAGVALLTVLTVYQLVQGGQLREAAQLGLAAPGLLALAAGLLALRVAVGSVRRVTARAPRTVAGVVVARQLSRAPSVLYEAVVIAVGTALVVFVVQVAAASVRNQNLRADAAVGAGTVLQVTVPPQATLLDLVRRADPPGRTAMAVQERAASSDSGSSRVVAVDAPRLGAVSTWRSTWAGMSAATLARALAPTGPPPVLLHGSRLTATVSGAVVQRNDRVPAQSARPDPQLVVTLDTGPRWIRVPVGPLSTAGPLTAPIPCTPVPCRVAWVGLINPSGSPYQATFTITSIRTNQQGPADFAAALHSAARWRPLLGRLQGESLPNLTNALTPRPGPSGLQIDAEDYDGNAVPAAEPTAVADPVPALAAAGAAVFPFAGIAHAAQGTGLDGQPQLLSLLGAAPVLPRSMGDGVLVDLGTISVLSDPTTAQVVNEVWLAPGNHPEVERRLTAAGLRVTGRSELATRQDAYTHEAPTRAALLTVLIAAAAAVLALQALVIARVIGAARRRRDWDSLRAAGLPRPRVATLSFAEVTVPALLGAAIGAAAGVAAFTLTGARLPLLAGAGATPPLDLSPPVGGLLSVLGAAVAAILLIGLLAAAADSRPTRPRAGA